MKRVADYIADFIYNQGIPHAFMVTGGGMMFLSDGIAAHPHLKAVCTHHEQAAAMAAVAYAKYKGQFGACYVTTGCGGTNAVTGLLNGFQDNIPCIFISGQSKRKETVRNSGLALRQFGVQEADIITVVQSLTKYAVMVNDPMQIAYHLEKAAFIANIGRPGPVWLDIPLDVQGAMIDENSLTHFSPEGESIQQIFESKEKDIKTVLSMLEKSQRPVIVAGQGIRLGKAIEQFTKFVEKFQIPVVSSKLGIDLFATDYPFYIGRIGNKGDRPGNFAVQNSDLVLSIGCRLSVSSTGHEYNKFARAAKIVVVDIDPVEHQKNTVKIDMFIQADAKIFLEKINNSVPPAPQTIWIEKCRHWKKKYPIYLPQYADDTEGINLYHFINSLSEAMPDDAAVVSDAGSSFYVTTQALRLKAGQRSISTGAQAEMGYSLPAAIGVCYAKNKGETIAITGDGSLQMNIQELQTVVHHNLPIKTFVWNNDGYLSIRATQRKFFDGRFIGTDSTCGVSFPDLKKISRAYGIKFFRLSKSKNLSKQIKKVLAYPGPVLCEVMCIRDQEIIPTVSSLRKDDGTMVSKPLEDMYPFLDRDEFRSEMIIEPLD
jgi:acetolactate synthase-1/2/3 large subunit